MHTHLDTTEIIINRVRSNKVDIYFMGYFGQGMESVTFDETPQKKQEDDYASRDLIQDWMLDRSNEMFVGNYEMIMDRDITPEILAAWKIGEKTKWIKTSAKDCWIGGQYVCAFFNGETILFAEMTNFLPLINSDLSPEVMEPILKSPTAGRFKNYTVEIDVPSGRLVFANDMRKLMLEEIDYHDVNKEIGIVRTVEDTAKQNFLTAFVGNTCPEVFADGNTLVVGSEGVDRETDDVIDPIKGSECGSICTDLWWFYAVDYDLFKELGGDDSHIEADATVEAGQYQMTVHERKEWDWEKAERFVTITRIGD